MLSIIAIAAVVSALGLGLAPASAHACGGFFCNGGGSGPTPVVQAAERVIFEKYEDGQIRAYVQIRYDGRAPVGFSWIIPVLARPEVSIAEASTFDALDGATNPQFRFINNAMPVASGGGVGCGAASADRGAFAPGADGTMDVEGVTVWDATRVGEYSTATISGDTAAALLEWLTVNGYDIPAEAEGMLEQYVTEGHLFVAFKYDPIGVGSGVLDPVVLTYTGEKPCVPLRITAIASNPILDVMILAFGVDRARPDGVYLLTEPDYTAVRPDFASASQTTYPLEVDRAISDAGGRAFVTEYAAPTSDVQGVTDIEARAILSRNAYVTRFYTRMAPEDMTVDPEFVFTGGEEVARLHVVDITPRSASASGLSSGLRYAMAPGILGLAGVALAFRRRRRRS
jgi:hypothetical protein